MEFLVLDQNCFAGFVVRLYVWVRILLGRIGMVLFNHEYYGHWSS